MAMLLQVHYCVKELAPAVPSPAGMRHRKLLTAQLLCSWQEGMVPFDVNVPVSGDIVIGIWFGAYNLGQRLHSRPAAAYAFHTAWFEDRQVERVTMHQMDVLTLRSSPQVSLHAALFSRRSTCVAVARVMSVSLGLMSFLFAFICASSLKGLRLNCPVSPASAQKSALALINSCHVLVS